MNLILFFAFPGTGYYGAPALIMPKLYANAVLMVLNARIMILGGRTTYISSSDLHPNSTGIRFQIHTTSTDAELGPLGSGHFDYSLRAHNGRTVNSAKTLNMT